MRTLIWFLFFWVTLLLLIPTMKKAQRLKADGDARGAKAIVDKKVFWWASSLLRLAGAEVTVEGKENIPRRPAVFVANHQGNFDIPILLTSLDSPHALVAKAELRNIPLIRSWMELLDCVFIDRSNARQSVTALREAADSMIRGGSSFIIFPEGTRSKGGPVGEFKNGGFKAAFKSGAPLVPICIQGSYRLMEAGGNWIHPAKVRVTILPPVETAGISKEESKTIGEEVRQQILSVMEHTPLEQA